MKINGTQEQFHISNSFLDVLNEPEFEKTLRKSGMFYVDYTKNFGRTSIICKSLGYSLDEMTSKRYQERIHLDDLDTYLRLWNRFDEGLDDELYCEYRLLDQDNKWNWIQTHATALSRDNSKSIIKILGFDRLINERKKTEKILHEKLIEEKKKNEISEIVLSTSKNIGFDFDLSTNLNIGLEKMKEVFDFDYCVTYIDQGESNLTFYYPPNVNLELPNTTELIEKVKNSKYPIIIDVISARIKSAMVVPLVYQSDFIGSLFLFSEKTGLFNGSDLYPVISFTNILTVTIVNHYTLKKIVNNLEKDYLTGFLTRKSFEKAMGNIWDDVRNKNKSIHVCMLDIDHFKQVNDSYGHQVGDEVISAIAQVCQRILREGDILGRYGGEEFILVLTDKDIVNVRRIMERIRSSIENHKFKDLDHGVTVSIGISQSIKEDSIKSVIERSDSALYSAKKAGRNRIVVS